MKKSICFVFCLCSVLSLFSCKKKSVIEINNVNKEDEKSAESDGWINLQELSLFCPEGVLNKTISGRIQNDYGVLSIVETDINEYFKEPEESDYLWYDFLMNKCKYYSIDDFRNMINSGEFNRVQFRCMTFSSGNKKIVQNGKGIGSVEMLQYGECYAFIDPPYYLATIATSNYVYEIYFTSKKSWADVNPFLEYIDDEEETRGRLGPNYFWKGKFSEDVRENVNNFFTSLENKSSELPPEYIHYQEKWEQILSSIKITDSE